MVELLRFRLDPGQNMSWRPGQHTELAILAAPELKVPYSIASIPDPRRPNELELALSAVGGQALLAALALGARVLVSPARGEFVWQPAPGPSLFIGIGTGIAPLRAMLHARLQHGGGEPTTLLFGARSQADLLFRDELEQLGRAHAHFSFVPTLSRPETTWSGRTGRVQQHLASIVGSASDPAVYLCGKREMVADCVARLLALGINEARVRSEAH